MAARIIVADGMATNRIALKSVLCTARHDVHAASTCDEVRVLIRKGGVGLILLDLDLPGDAVSLLQIIRSDPESASLPVIAMIDRSDPAPRIAALSAGADDILLKPVATVMLLARVRGLLRSADTRAALSARAETVRDLGFAEHAADFAAPGAIALVTPDPSQARSLVGVLGAHTAHRLAAMDADGALALADSDAPPDLFLLYAQPDRPTHALRLLTDVRSQPAARHASIVLIHERHDPDTAAMAMDLGANAVIEAGITPAELALHLDIQVRRKDDSDRLRAAIEERLRLAVEDPLTGLFNRRYAMTHLGRLARGPELERIAILVADIDRFKSVNDRYGHATGDRVLTEVAHRLRDNLRGPDMVARIGGEEFLVVLMDTDPTAALAAAERLRDQVRRTPVARRDDSSGIPVTISLGLSMLCADEPVEAAIERADRALYEAKAAGRDTVTVAPESHAA